MRRIHYLAFAAVAAASFAVGPAYAASCQAEHMTCATTMPVGGYCECTVRGSTEGGTVVERPMSRRSTNATAGGCGTQPNAPGCR